MSVDVCMERLMAALQRRLEADKPVQFWLRDDDAVEPGNALDQMLAITGEQSVPLTLAVIPAFTGTALRQRLAGAPQVLVAVHGWSHQNHAPVGEKKQELGAHRPRAQVVDELRRGFVHLSDLYDTQFLPMLVPPWNRISATLVPALSDIGFRALSTFDDQAFASMPMINTHVDIIDWKQTRGGRPTQDLVSEIVAQLDGGRQSTGLLTHHLVHDDQAWQFLEQFLAVTRQHPAVRWVTASELLQASGLPDPGFPQQQ